MREVNAVIQELRTQHGPLASHIFISRRYQQNLSATRAAKGIICRLGSVGDRQRVSLINGNAQQTFYSNATLNISSRPSGLKPQP